MKKRMRTSPLNIFLMYFYVCAHASVFYTWRVNDFISHMQWDDTPRAIFTRYLLSWSRVISQIEYRREKYIYDAMKHLIQRGEPIKLCNILLPYKKVVWKLVFCVGFIQVGVHISLVWYVNHLSQRLIFITA